MTITKETVRSIIESEEMSTTVSLALSSVITSRTSQILEEGSFTRAISIRAAALATGVGVTKLTSAIISANGLPEWMVGVYKATAAFLAHQAPTLASTVSSELVSFFGLNASLGVVGLQFLPVALPILMGIRGGMVIYYILTKTFEKDKATRKAYDDLVKAVDKRDRLIKNQSNQSDAAAQRLVKRIDKSTGDIVKTSRRLERLVANNSNHLTDEEIDTFHSFIAYAKNGMVSNAKGIR